MVREDEPAGRNVELEEQSREGFAVMVLTDEACEQGGVTEGAEAASDVSSAAGEGLSVAYFSDGDRSIGRELI